MPSSSRKSRPSSEEVVSNEAKRSGNSAAEDEVEAPEPTRLPPAQRWGHLLLCGAGGFAQCLGFAGFSLWPFALFCFLPMFWVLDREPAASNRRILGLGLFHGAVGYCGGYYWLYTFLETFSGYSGLPSLAFASVFWVYQGGQQMLIYWLYAKARRRGWSVTAAAVPALLALEVGYPVLFPAYLASGFHNVPLLMQVADLGGPMLLSAVVMAFNGALYEGLRSARRSEPFPLRTIALVTAAVVFTVGYGAWRIAEVDARAQRSEKVEVGMVQVAMGIFEKRDDPFEGHRRHLQQSQSLQARHPELGLLVWPESAYTRFVPEGLHNVGTTILPGVHTPTIFGGLARRQVDGEERHYNTAYITDARAEIAGTYDKTYLLAFGEYLPMGETFPELYQWSPNSGHFTPGNHVRPLVLERVGLPTIRATTLICYEDVLPGFTRRAVREGEPNLLVNITNDAWFGDTHEPWIHLALAKFRAVEHHRALARSTNSGVSAFVDPVGRTLDEIPFGGRDEIVAELPLLDQPTLYQWVGDWPGWAGLIAILAMAFVRRRKRPGTTVNAT